MGKTIIKDKRKVKVQPNWSSGKIEFSDALLSPYKGIVVEVEFIVREYDADKVVQETSK
jgi:hypothetical protein